MQDRPASTLPENTDRFYTSLLDRVVSGMLGALPADDVEAVLMIGAPARGEATVVTTPDGPFSLSDVDLVCLARPGADVPALRRRLASWVSKANAEFGGGCAGIDASVKVRGEGAGIQSLISTFEMMRSPVVLWGDEAVLRELPRVAIGDVPARDSLTLFHNRVVEQVLLSRTPEPPADLRIALGSLYASGKFLLDAVTAYLFLEKDVPPTYAERGRVFAGKAMAAGAGGWLHGAMEPYLADIETWSRFKASGDVGSLGSLWAPGSADRRQGPNARRGGPHPGGAEAGPTSGAWTADDVTELAGHLLIRYASCADVMWRAILGRVAGVEAHELDLGGIVSLYASLEPTWRKVGRAVKMLRAPAGRSGLFSTPAVMRLALFASPLQLTYLTAVLVYLSLDDTRDPDVLSSHIDRFCPLRVSPGFSELPLARKRALLADRLAIFHSSVLRGRETTGTE